VQISAIKSTNIYIIAPTVDVKKTPKTKQAIKIDVFKQARL
jgi:hypothetical protein